VTDPPKRKVHRLVPLALLALGVAGMAESSRLGLGAPVQPGPGMWPLLVAGLLCIAAAVLLFVDDRRDYEPWTRRSLVVLAGLLSLVVYIYLFAYLGFLLASALMLGTWLRLFAAEPWKRTVPLALVGSVALYLLFEVALKVPFPDGLFALAGGQ